MKPSPTYTRAVYFRLSRTEPHHDFGFNRAASSSRRVQMPAMIDNTAKSGESHDEVTIAAFEPPYWERVALFTRWGAYVSHVVHQVIMKGHAVAGKPNRALEIGCEGGRWSKLLSDLGWEMTCIDVNRDVLDVCQKRIPAARCILASSRDETVPCESGSVDLLLCLEVAPVIQSDWFLPEAHRVLKPEGVVVGVLLNRASWRGILTRAKYRLVNRSNGDFYARSYSDWRRQLGRTGFQLVHEEGFCWWPFGRQSNSPLVTPLTRAERLLKLHRLTSLSPWVAFAARKRPEEAERS